MNRQHLAGVSLIALIATSIPATAQEPIDTTLLEPIVVTSGKRSEDLFLLPSAIDVATPKDLQMRNVTSVADLDKVFADLNIRSRSSRAYANFTIRGQASLDFYNPSTQVYVDGIPLDMYNMSRTLPAALESAELLYGPQGTLYGRGAIGGVINIVTRKPDETFRFESTGALHTEGGDARLLVNAPIIDGTLFGEAALTVKRQKDSYTTLFTGEDVGGTKDVNGQMRLRYAPEGSPLDVTIAAGRGHVSSTEEYFVMESMIDQRLALPIPSKYDLDSEHANINASYDLGAATITSLSGYQKSDFDRTVFGTYTPEKQTTWSQELRISSNAGSGNAIDYVAGAYLQHIDFNRQVPVAGQTSQQKIQSYALFGDLTWHATDRLDISPGLRFDYERAAAKALGGITLEDDNSFTALSPKLAVAYSLDDAWRVYALYSTGFKAGGFTRNVTAANIAYTYDPQHTYNGEAGVKYRSEDGRLEAQLSAYHNITRDYQMFVGVQPLQYLQNVGEVTSSGVDLKIRSMPTDNLGITAALGYNRTRFTDYANPVTPGLDLTGNRVPYAPALTANVTLDYTFELENGKGELIPYAGVTYTGKSYFDETNTVGQKAYALVDVGMEWKVNETVAAEVFVNNLFDKTYATYGFNAGAPYGNVYQLGTGRTIGGRLNLTF